MRRRELIYAGLLTGGALALPQWGRALGHALAPGIPHLAAVKGGEAEVMFDRAMQALGGMQAFVKKGQKVVVKPNIGWDAGPERAANTNPALIARIVKRCLEAGAREVVVFDNTCDTWNLCYASSGIEKAAKAAGARIAPGHLEGYYQQVSIPNGVKLKEAKVHEALLESDVFINVPILKHHSSADLSIAMKNLMGVVWDRRYWHRNDLHQCIADFTLWRTPDLNVVDAYRVMKKNGPRGVSVADTTIYKMQVVSRDIVAADAASAKIFGSDPASIGHIRKAAASGVGRMDLDKLDIQRISL
ncbi:MAG TPA: DUF362 domain-containing protein [Bacteroidales bacterium]|nr:DUF362 domain-containing protein [Bacteroidales bacterium]HRZ76095.1 DUF362 domain-containing protein [Bacteroidales bacterium]